MPTTLTDFEERFAPTSEQIKFASEYAIEAGLSSVFVAVNFPGKEYGIWLDGQVREPVMDGTLPAIWTDRDSAMAALDSQKYGNTMFRIYADGEIGAAIEYL